MREDRDRLILEHLSLAVIIAKDLYKTVPKQVGVDDLISAGYLGLVKAAGRYKSAMHVPFRYYAGKVIKGSILDYLRERDWATRRQRKEMKLSGDIVLMFSLDAVPFDEMQRATVCPPLPIAQIMDARQDRKSLASAMKTISVREQRMLKSYYWRGLTMLAISKEEHVNESRVSQIIFAAKRKLKPELLARGMVR